MLSAHERLLVGRYLLPGVGGRLALLVAMIGSAGVAIGVAALILVVSFMNGTDARLAGRIGAVDGHLSVTRARHALPDWRLLAARTAAMPGVVRAAPVLAQTGLVSVAGRVQPASFQGMRLADMARLPAFSGREAMVIGHLPTALGEVAIGAGLSERLGIVAGDQLTILSIVAGPDGALRGESTPLRVAGIYRVNVPDYDDRRVILPMADLQRIFARGDVASRIDVNARSEEASQALVAPLRSTLGPAVLIQRWRDLNAAIFAALAQERFAMATAVSLVTLIALANILSSLGLLARFKRHEIAMLRTMGMTAGSVTRVFVATGLAIGLAGEATGLVLGLGLKAAKDPATAFVRQRLGASPELDLFLDLPLILSGPEVAAILAAVTGGVLLASWLPARSAAAIDPARALRSD